MLYVPGDSIVGSNNGFVPLFILPPDHHPPRGFPINETGFAVLHIEKSAWVVVGGTTTTVTVSDCGFAGPKSLTDTTYCVVTVGQTWCGPELFGKIGFQE